MSSKDLVEGFSDVYHFARLLVLSSSFIMVQSIIPTESKTWSIRRHTSTFMAQNVKEKSVKFYGNPKDQRSCMYLSNLKDKSLVEYI